MNHHPRRPEASHRLILRKTHRGQFRLTEHGARHQFMVDLPRPLAIDAVGEGTTFVDRNGETDAFRHIANGEDMGDVRALISIHRDPMPFNSDARRLQIESFQERPSTCRQQNTTAGQLLPGVRGHHEIPWHSSMATGLVEKRRSMPCSSMPSCTADDSSLSKPWRR